MKVPEVGWNVGSSGLTERQLLSQLRTVPCASHSNNDVILYLPRHSTMDTSAPSKSKDQAVHDANLTYLHQCAQALSTSSQSTSAFLESRYNNLQSEAQLDEASGRANSTAGLFRKQSDSKSKPADTRWRHVCGACGNIMVPGWSCHSESASTRPRYKRPRASGTSKQAAIARQFVQTCIRCGRSTAFKIDSEPRRKQKSAGATTHEVPATLLNRARSPSNIAAPLLETKPAASNNSSAKQRAKARKQGLQAQLAKSKTDTASRGFGLDLMDLMKGA